ncbi:hypothetical protein [Mucilaginibacter pedocola]|uniref:Uncharacterized protein n=1 Tax=Mucilaginibacter pedocola TaxID=1792845 RepID=A0A1S9PMI8_9SPHI|nr:hypothetical protein [Mucilaginibacter pedocola]OOQ62163.1 hypothetical protein BC343_03695 [Mucilaginibacter pedocola]
MGSINLKDFISEAITQITEGIIQAQSLNADKGCIVNPKIIQTIGAPDGITYKIDSGGQNSGTVSVLKFDLIIDANEKSEIGGRLKVMAGVVGIGAGGKNEVNTSVNNKLTFAIPVMFPIVSD